MPLGFRAKQGAKILQRGVLLELLAHHFQSAQRLTWRRGFRAREQTPRLELFREAKGPRVFQSIRAPCSAGRRALMTRQAS